MYSCHIVGIIGSLELSWIDSIFFCFRWDVKIRGMINPTLRLNRKKPHHKEIVRSESLTKKTKTSQTMQDDAPVITRSSKEKTTYFYILV